jgi:phospholipid-binding lipoprotein MlaA
MKTDKRLWLLLVAVLAGLWFIVPGTSNALYAAEPENHGNAGSGADDPAVLNEMPAIPGASAQSYYVVDDNLYVLVQKPMTKAYGAFSMVPMFAPDAAGDSAIDAGSDGLSSGDPLLADAGSAPDSADKENENIQGIEVAINMNFRGAADNAEETASNADSSQDTEDIADPFEPINRAFFTFNDKLYFWALKPLATAYGAIVPEWGRTRVKNVFENIKAPIRMVNALLQLKMHKFGAEFAKFVLNSTVGLGGLFDLASRHPELKTSGEDLGQTFGAYGIGEGFYMVLPFLGPSSLRDSIGIVGDSFLNPISYIRPLRDWVAVRSFDEVSDTSFKIGDYEDMKESAVDPYLAIRDLYKQVRRNKIRE